MSVTIMSRVFWTPIPNLVYTDSHGEKATVHSSTCKIVLLAIADNGNDDGEHSWQSMETLAKKASVDRRTVTRAVHALIKNNYLSISGISKYGTNDYVVNLDVLEFPPVKRSRSSRSQSQKSVDSVAGEEISVDSDAKSVDSVAESVDSVTPESSLNINKHQLVPAKILADCNRIWGINLQVETKQGKKLCKFLAGRPADETIERFAEWWDKYHKTPPSCYTMLENWGAAFRPTPAPPDSRTYGMPEGL